MRKGPDHVARSVRVGDLTFDEGFNRDVDRAWVRKLVADLDSRAVGAIIASQRTDATLVVIDGQHRVRAVLEKWGPSTTVECVVHRGLSRADEAHLFYRLNMRRGLRPFDRFRAEVVAQHPDALAIVRLLDERGLSYCKGTQSKAIGAIKAMESAYKLGTLGEALTLLADSWGYARSTWDGYLIEGAALFLGRYANANVDSLRHKLAKYRGGAEGFLGRADQWRVLHRISMARGVAALMVDTYNTRRDANGALPPWS